LANLGCGYDVLGLAIDGPGDEVVVREGEGTEGIVITQITGDDGLLPQEAAKNTAGIAAQKVLDRLGIGGSFEMEIHKKMPFGSGLGSSAASAVAGAFAMNELLGAPLERRDLLEAAMHGEEYASKAWHADNVAPCLLGGICLVRDNNSFDVLNLPVPEDLWLTVLYDPSIEILTAEARERVPKEVPTNIATTQAANLASFVSALYEKDFTLMSRAMVDRIAEPTRQPLISSFEASRQKAMEAGALAFGISGSGPSLYALSHGQVSAHNVAKAFDSQEIEVYVSRVNTKGAVRLA